MLRSKTPFILQQNLLFTNYATTSEKIHPTQLKEPPHFINFLIKAFYTDTFSNYV